MRRMLLLVVALLAGCGSSASSSSGPSDAGGAVDSGAAASLSGDLAFPYPIAQSYARFGHGTGDGGLSRAPDGGRDLSSVDVFIGDDVDVTSCGVFGSSSPDTHYYQVYLNVQGANGAAVAAGSWPVAPWGSQPTDAAVKYIHAEALPDAGWVDLYATRGTATLTAVSPAGATGSFDAFFPLDDGGSSELKGTFTSPLCPNP